MLFHKRRMHLMSWAVSSGGCDIATRQEDRIVGGASGNQKSCRKRRTVQISTSVLPIFAERNVERGVPPRQDLVAGSGADESSRLHCSIGVGCCSEPMSWRGRMMQTV